MNSKKFLITKDGSHTLFVPELNETYHSTHGAIQESTYVFIDRGLKFSIAKDNRKLGIFEVGFGTGLNVLLSVLFAKENHLTIAYETVEAYPLGKSEIKQLNYTTLLEDQSAKQIYDKIHAGEWNVWREISEGFQLKKVEKKFQAYDRMDEFDLCYFDAFAPSKQPEMWDITVLEKISSKLSLNGVFVTYCAKGQLKRDLASLGFEVETLPGPPGKKEMVRAIKI